ncbi:MAG: hypothetical protein AAGN15_20375 [Cyanobacteria bacterium J06581_3]
MRDDTRLIISSNRIRSYASAGPVIDVVIYDDSEITVTAEMTESGYPPFTQTFTYQLSEDRSELTDIKDSFNITRQKCPTIQDN